jgi:hypothetical protein
MPFNPDTKARMFIKCARLCCLCLKQCGTNIEAAHIHDESKGGSNDESNGIPLCFDCHQEIGAYNKDHPKGNKFSQQELIARRDRIYALVESGVIFAQTFAGNARARTKQGDVPSLDIDPVGKPSQEAEKLLAKILDKDSIQNTFAGKIKLLSSSDRAFILDQLAEKSPQMPRAVEILMAIATSPLVSPEEAKVVIERTIRHVTLYGTPYAKASMLRGVPPQYLAEAAEELREAIFEEAIEIIKNDQFGEVNELVPALERHSAAVPLALQFPYVSALFDQARSRSHQGAPAARRIIHSLPHLVAASFLSAVDAKGLITVGEHDLVQDFVASNQQLAVGHQSAMTADFLAMPARAFAQKYWPDEN